MAFLVPATLPLRSSLPISRSVTKLTPRTQLKPSRGVVKAAVNDIDSPDYNFYKAVKADARRPAIGFTMYAELMNGRAAMIGFIAALAIELITGEGLVGKLQSFLAK